MLKKWQFCHKAFDKNAVKKTKSKKTKKWDTMFDRPLFQKRHFKELQFLLKQMRDTFYMYH